MSIQIDIYLCGCSLMVEPQPSKLTTGVRFSSSAPYEIQELVNDWFFFISPVVILEVQRNYSKRINVFNYDKIDY